MLDLELMRRIRLRPRPLSQRLLAYGFLLPQYVVNSRVPITFEGQEKVPDDPVIFAMNHTDFYTFFPFMYHYIRFADRYTSAWVKGKNYDSRAMATFMEVTNNIPVPSRGYLLARDFLNTMERKPTEEEYRALRDHCERGGPTDGIPAELLGRARDLFGHAFDPSKESYQDALDAVFRTMMRIFVELNGQAFETGLDLLVFPQGGRSVRLSRGHVGMSQIALHYRRTIVPVGANNVDLVYPGKSVLAKPAEVVYRFGDPISYEEMAPFHVPEGFEPFSPEAEQRHREQFQGLVDMVMDRIEPLLDPRHRYTDDRESDGLEGSERFV